MSIFADLINATGPENFQGLLAVIIAGLLGKNSWDVYKSKDIASRAEIDAHLDKLKKEMGEQLEEARVQLKELRESALEQVKEEVKDISSKTVHRLEKFEAKFNEMQNKSEELTKKMVSLLNDYGKPKISRAEIRRMKDVK
jgi:F0F1-type ATP synthase membrane subunit b/b'